MAVWRSTGLQNRLSQVRVLHTVPSRRATRTLPGIHKDISVTLGIYTALDKFAPPLEPPFFKTFREMGVISAHIPLERHFPSQTKIPEKPGMKPLFGDFTLELLIRFERTTCSLRVSCSTG